MGEKVTSNKQKVTNNEQQVKSSASYIALVKYINQPINVIR